MKDAFVVRSYKTRGRWRATRRPLPREEEANKNKKKPNGRTLKRQPASLKGQETMSAGQWSLRCDSSSSRASLGDSHWLGQTIGWRPHLPWCACAFHNNNNKNKPNQTFRFRVGPRSIVFGSRWFVGWFFFLVLS